MKRPLDVWPLCRSHLGLVGGEIFTRMIGVEKRLTDQGRPNIPGETPYSVKRGELGN